MNSSKHNAPPEVRCITVVFHENGRRYDYKSINPDIKVGDEVIVEVKGVDQTVVVISTSATIIVHPPFEYKWIIRKKSKEEKENDRD